MSERDFNHRSNGSLPKGRPASPANQVESITNSVKSLRRDHQERAVAAIVAKERFDPTGEIATAIDEADKEAAWRNFVDNMNA